MSSQQRHHLSFLLQLAFVFGTGYPQNGLANWIIDAQENEEICQPSRGEGGGASGSALRLSAYHHSALVYQPEVAAFIETRFFSSTIMSPTSAFDQSCMT